MATKKTASCVVELFDKKGKVDRYKGNDEMMSSGYFGHKALKKIGNPERIKVTIEPADEED
jgi:hypothetical protein